MKTSDRGIIALIGHEGIVPGPYYDSAGVRTYGVGHTASAGEPYPALMPGGMPANLDAELVRVFAVFRCDLERYEQAVDAAIKVPVTQHEFDAAVSFHFNTGAIARAAWVRHLNAGNRAAAGAGITNWRRPPEIIPRRKAEQTLFRSGAYPDNTIDVWSVSPSGKVIWKAVRRLTPDTALSLLRGAASPDAPFAAFFAAIMRIFK